MKYPNTDIYDKINWHRLKNLYKNNPNNDDINKILYAISSFRKYSIEMFKVILFDNFIETCYNEAGSTNLTSDLDFTYINLTYPSLSVIMMDLFYKIFNNIFNDESSNVFDMNYYICSTYIGEDCYTQNSKNIIAVKLINYGVTSDMIFYLYRLFNVCSNDDVRLYMGNSYDLSDTTIKSACDNNVCDCMGKSVLQTLDNFFIKKNISINDTNKVIYHLDFPLDCGFLEHQKYVVIVKIK
jgi:hypothetical protein